METDRAVALAGGEPHFLQDLVDETSWYVVEDPPDAIAGNITNLQAWIENVNSKMGRGGG